MDRQSVPGLFARLCLLLRAQDPQLSGSRHRTRLRLPDRRQDQRPGAAAHPARVQSLARRAHRDGHQCRLLPARRGPVPADARHHLGPARPREPVLDPDQGNADPARSGAAAAGGRGHRRRHLRLGRLRRRRAVAHRRARHPVPRAPPRRRPHPERARHRLRGAHGPRHPVPRRPSGPAARHGPRHRRRRGDLGHPLVLHLRPGAREWYMQWLGNHHPHLVRRYERLYAEGPTRPSGTSAASPGTSTSWRPNSASDPRTGAPPDGSPCAGNGPRLPTAPDPPSSPCSEPPEPREPPEPPQRTPVGPIRANGSTLDISGPSWCECGEHAAGTAPRAAVFPPPREAI